MQIDKPPLLPRIYTVPLLMTPGQCIETKVETEPGWYRMMHETVRASDTSQLDARSFGVDKLSAGELVRVTDVEIIKDKADEMARIALKFDWRLRHSVRTL